MGNELDPRVREMLPSIASFPPKVRYDSIQMVKDFLIPGKQKTKGAGGLLPALGIVLDGEPIKTGCVVLSVPKIISAGGFDVPASKAENWAPVLSKANFRIDPKAGAKMSGILFVSSFINQNAALGVYGNIQRFVNNFNAKYRLSEKPTVVIQTGNNEKHWGEVEKVRHYLSLNSLFLLLHLRIF